jgi:hypothetical protein
MDDHYATLGVSETATTDEIKKAWRKSVVTHHPDRGGQRAKFDQVQQAWEVLGNEGQRAAYDRARRRAADQASYTVPGESSFTWTWSDGTAPDRGRTAAEETARRRAAPPPRQQAPTQDVGMLFVFADGTEVAITKRNKHGAWVPTESQRSTYRMGASWVYDHMRPGDKVLRVPNPRPAVHNGGASVYGLLLLEWLVKGPRWLRPRWRWLAALTVWFTALTLSTIAHLLAGGFLGRQPSQVTVTIGMLAVWWPVSRGIATLWCKSPAWVAGAATGASAGALAMLATWAPLAVLVVVAAAGAGIGAVLATGMKWLRSWVIGHLPRSVADLFVRLGS